MKLINRKIFISGGAGFVGSNFVERLIKNNRITVYDNLSSGKKAFLSQHLGKNGFRLIAADLLDLKKLKTAMKGHEMVIHLAANPDIRKGTENPSLDLEQGVITAFNVLEAMKANEIGKIVYFSGSGVYGDQGNKYLAEDFSPLLPVSMYGASKLAGEALISAFCHLFDFQAWIFRPANLVGPHQTHGVGYDFINKLLKNPKELEILGNGRQSKSYLHISDAVAAVLMAIEKANERVNIFNLSSDSFITVTEIAKIVARQMNLKNIGFKYTGGRSGWKGDIPKVKLNSQKIKNLGWKPKLNSKQAIQKSVNELLQERCRQ